MSDMKLMDTEDEVRFPPESDGYSVMGKIHWSHLRAIMRLDNEEERNFYLTEVANEYWSVKELERNIKSGYYKRILSTQFPDKTGENQKFLLEMGKGFCFVDRQMHICTETSDFYIDLVFYNYILDGVS